MTPLEQFGGKPDAYFRYVARKFYLPDLWIEDCLQEMAIKMWLHPEMKPSIIATQIAIDMLRWLKKSQTPYIFLEPEYKRNEYKSVEEMIDANHLLGKLTPGELRGLTAVVFRGHATNGEKVLAFKARKRLRSLQETA